MTTKPSCPMRRRPRRRVKTRRRRVFSRLSCSKESFSRRMRRRCFQFRKWSSRNFKLDWNLQRWSWQRVKRIEVQTNQNSKRQFWTRKKNPFKVQDWATARRQGIGSRLHQLAQACQESKNKKFFNQIWKRLRRISKKSWITSKHHFKIVLQNYICRWHNLNHNSKSKYSWAKKSRKLNTSSTLGAWWSLKIEDRCNHCVLPKPFKPWLLITSKRRKKIWQQGRLQADQNRNASWRLLQNLLRKWLS